MYLRELVLVVCFVTTVGTAEAAAPPRSDPRSVAELIRDLGAEAYETREEATLRLRNRENALSELKVAAKSGDLEVRRRAISLVRVIEERQSERRFRRAIQLMDQGHYDMATVLLVPLTESRANCISEELFKGVEKLLDAIKRQHKDERAKPKSARFSADFSWYAPKKPAKIHFSASKLAVRRIGGSFLGAAAITFERSLDTSIVLATTSLIGKGQDTNEFIGTLAVVNGPVEVGHMCMKSILISDGPVTLSGVGSFNVIIARGPIQCNVIAASVLCSTTKILASNHGACLLKEHDPHPLGLIRFFESRQTGIDVTSGKGRVVVAALARDKAFATAGVRVGDAITALGDAKVTDPESFRKLLRVHAAELSPFTLSLDRDGKKRTVRVSLTE